MREIKFRFFCNGKMYYPTLIGLVHDHDDNPAIYTTVDGMEHVPHYKDGALMQFTGLHDKNGREIYEADILDFDEREWGEPGFKSVVEWDEKDACWSFSGGTPSEVKEWRAIIGNIYENPELLEVKK